MKKYLYCVLLFAVTSVISLAAEYALTRYQIRQEQGMDDMMIETETVNPLDNRAAVGQESITPVVETPS